MSDSFSDEDGSILPMILGYFALALAVIVVCVCATDLRIAQKRLDALAASAALAGADGFSIVINDGRPQAVLEPQEIQQQADSLLAEVAPATSLVSAGTPDGVTVDVVITTRWHPPFVSAFVPDGVSLRAEATSRTALY